ncbi:endonuclease MutS2 [Faecalimonas umbilicata]|uniref:endonuclease MutS2 n=1 Tax=Faecalimonas umbilicata TaxID=1912855 RepID=UPI002A8136AE|nr:DNA mismatch repair protein MutS [Faecalimonas umbilicata]MDY4596250.1 DNA mismatch repair protein MutS [Faecalimonas umbilicata]
MNQEEKVLEIDKIKQEWSDYAMTETVKEKIREMAPILSESELIFRLRETTEAKKLLEICGNPPLVTLEGVTEIIKTTEQGGCLQAEQLELIRNALVAVRRLKSYLERGKMQQISLAYYEENLSELKDVAEEIEAAVLHGTVMDKASAKLQDVRRKLARCEEKMREKADQMIRNNKKYMSDSFSTFRNGHLCIPVKKEYKYKIAGAVIDQSATGSTLFIEPSSVERYYEEAERLRIEEEEEILRILYTLTALVGAASEEIRQNVRTIERLDFAFSKGKWSLEHEGTEPELLQERKICLTDARHPLLEKESCVPLQFAIGGDIRGIVITGPNTGGKTVALKTVALCCMLMQFGMHVPCREAEICMCSNFLCDIGDGQNLSENLSTFSAHITNMLEILKRVGPESLVIMDELGSGTDPQEGMGIAVAILEELKKSGALFLVTTHYPEVKTYATQEPGIENARMTFDRENLTPLYQMVIGEAGESCALHIARRLGMPKRMLKRAMEAAYGRQPKERKESADAVEIQQSLLELSGAEQESLEKVYIPRIQRRKAAHKKKDAGFQRGDSVMVYPDQKIGIVCEPANEKGVLRVQVKGKKIWINQKRIKLLVPAEQLYPEDYDFSIVFETAEHRKLRHDMERKYVEEAIYHE